jgi:hypothetical protein
MAVVVLGVACSRLPSLDLPSSEERNVELTADVVAGVWVGHVSGATYTFAADGTFEAVGVPSGTFEDVQFRLAAPIGPHRCRGAWRVGEDRHLLVLDVTSIRDGRDGQPYPQPRVLTFSATQWVSDPPDVPAKPVTLRLGEDWMTEK